MGKVKKTLKQIAKGTMKFVERNQPIAKAKEIAKDVSGKKKGSGKKRMTIASIKRKIALLKAKKELAKVRGY